MGKSIVPKVNVVVSACASGTWRVWRVAGVFERAYFPEITRNYVKLYGDSLSAELNTVLINGELALVGGSGEFFCNHANRLKARSYVKHTLFFGYCNGYCNS